MANEYEILDASTISSLQADTYELQSDIPFMMKDIRKEIRKSNNVEREDVFKLNMKKETNTNKFYKRVKEFFDLGLNK